MHKTIGNTGILWAAWGRILASCLYFVSVWGHVNTLSFSQVCNIGEAYILDYVFMCGTFFPPVFPLIKLFSTLFIYYSPNIYWAPSLCQAPVQRWISPILVPRTLPVQKRQLYKLLCLFPCSPKIALCPFFSHLWNLSLFMLHCHSSDFQSQMSSRLKWWALS